MLCSGEGERESNGHWIALGFVLPSFNGLIMTRAIWKHNVQFEQKCGANWKFLRSDTVRAKMAIIENMKRWLIVNWMVKRKWGVICNIQNFGGAFCNVIIRGVQYAIPLLNIWVCWIRDLFLPGVTRLSSTHVQLCFYGQSSMPTHARILLRLCTVSVFVSS